MGMVVGELGVRVPVGVPVGMVVRVGVKDWVRVGRENHGRRQIWGGGLAIGSKHFVRLFIKQHEKAREA